MGDVAALLALSCAPTKREICRGFGIRRLTKQADKRPCMDKGEKRRGQKQGEAALHQEEGDGR